MADKTFALTIITPARTVFSGSVESLVAPAYDGEVGILPGHAPFMALLGPGLLRLRVTGGQAQQLAVRGGFLQVAPSGVTVLTPAAVDATQIVAADLDRELAQAQARPAQAEEELAQKEQELGWVRARKRLLSA